MFHFSINFNFSLYFLGKDGSKNDHLPYNNKGNLHFHCFFSIFHSTSGLEAFKLILKRRWQGKFASFLILIALRYIFPTLLEIHLLTSHDRCCFTINSWKCFHFSNLFAETKSSCYDLISF